MTRFLSPLFVILLAVGTSAAQVAPPPPPLQVVTGVVLDLPVVQNVGANFSIVVTGTLSLAKTDTFSGFTITFKDPNMTVVSPTLNSFTAPQPGGKSTFKYTVYTTTQGTWTIDASMNYMTNNTPGIKTDSKTASVKP